MMAVNRPRSKVALTWSRARTSVSPSPYVMTRSVATAAASAAPARWWVSAWVVMCSLGSWWSTYSLHEFGAGADRGLPGFAP